ncbi:MAG: heme-binding protein [Faecalimonas sp.]|nr:heme-binding protein [Faecalimonas sp.]
MNEQMISKAVEEVIRQMTSEHAEKNHVCKCKKHKMSLALAKSLIERVEQKAKEIGLVAVIAVSDQAGRVTAVHCMDGAYIASYDIAVNKTFTSASLKMSTAELAKLAQPGADLYGIQFTNDGKIVIFGGGEPLEVEGKIIGAIGVSGGTAEQDTMLAVYGKEILKEVISCL